jgi:hypothetical protein
MEVERKEKPTNKLSQPQKPFSTAFGFSSF